MSTGRDITELKQTEAKLSYQKQLLETIIDGTKDILSIHLPNHVVELYNQAGYEFLGLTPDKAHGRKCFELIGRRQPCKTCPSEMALERKEPVTIEKYVPELGVCLDCSVSPVLDDVGRVIKIVQHLRDITEKKQAEEELMAANEKLQKANAEKDKLFAILAHDLRSPVAGIHSTSQILAQDTEHFSMAEISFISKEMHKSSKNVLDLLNDLMQWARMSQGGIDFSPEKSNLYELIRTSLHTTQDVARKKNISIKCEIPKDLNVLVDQPMIKTVIRNVIFNAIKFTNRGGNISLKARKTDSMIEISVNDSGIGIHESIIPAVFTFDKNKKQTGTDGEKGSGLGLILCKEFIGKHEGEIWLESEPGQGTKVSFTLPAA